MMQGVGDEGQERRRMSGCSQNIKNCRITPNKMSATDKEACLVVAEVQTSGESVGLLLFFLFVFFFSTTFFDSFSNTDIV